MSNIITDSELVAQYAKKAMEEPEAEITSRAPSDTTVTLPGGVLTERGELVTTAEVRELTGSDEEAIAKAGGRAKALNVLLQRGVVKIGTKEATKEDLDNLLSGDRDALLIGIRRVTFGDTIPVSFRCVACNELQQQDIDLSTDVPITTLDDPLGGRTWIIETKQGPVGVALPTGIVQRKLMDNSDKSGPELNTLLLAGCILSVNGSPSMGATTALALGMSERTKIVNEIIAKNPGPRLGEVKKPCKACGEESRIPLSLSDLF